MTVYKDMTFCSRGYSGRCLNTSCPVFFGAKQRKDAIAWWGGKDFPVSLTDLYTSTCGFIRNDKFKTPKPLPSDILSEEEK